MLNKLLRILLGNTETPLVKGRSKEIVFDRELSSQIYDKIDLLNEFIIQKGNKKYKVKTLNKS